MLVMNIMLVIGEVTHKLQCSRSVAYLRNYASLFYKYAVIHYLRECSTHSLVGFTHAGFFCCALCHVCSYHVHIACGNSHLILMDFIWYKIRTRKNKMLVFYLNANIFIDRGGGVNTESRRLSGALKLCRDWSSIAMIRSHKPHRLTLMYCMNNQLNVIYVW